MPRSNVSVSCAGPDLYAAWESGLGKERKLVGTVVGDGAEKGAAPLRLGYGSRDGGGAHRARVEECVFVQLIFAGGGWWTVEEEVYR